MIYRLKQVILNSDQYIELVDSYRLIVCNRAYAINPLSCEHLSFSIGLVAHDTSKALRDAILRLYSDVDIVKIDGESVKDNADILLSASTRKMYTDILDKLQQNHDTMLKVYIANLRQAYQTLILYALRVAHCDLYAFQLSYIIGEHHIDNNVVAKEALDNLIDIAFVCRSTDNMISLTQEGIRFAQSRSLSDIVAINPGVLDNA